MANPTNFSVNADLLPAASYPLDANHVSAQFHGYAGQTLSLHNQTNEQRSAQFVQQNPQSLNGEIDALEKKLKLGLLQEKEASKHLKTLSSHYQNILDSRVAGQEEEATLLKARIEKQKNRLEELETINNDLREELDERDLQRFEEENPPSPWWPYLSFALHALNLTSIIVTEAQKIFDGNRVAINQYGQRVIVSGRDKREINSDSSEGVGSSSSSSSMESVHSQSRSHHDHSHNLRAHRHIELPDGTTNATRTETEQEVLGEHKKELKRQWLEQESKIAHHDVDEDGRVIPPIIDRIFVETAQEKIIVVSPCQARYTLPPYTAQDIADLAAHVQKKIPEERQERRKDLDRLAQACFTYPPPPSESDAQKITVHIHRGREFVEHGISDHMIRGYFSQFESEMTLVSDFNIAFKIHLLPKRLAGSKPDIFSQKWKGQLVRWLVNHSDRLNCSTHEKRVVLKLGKLELDEGMSTYGVQERSGSFGVVGIDPEKPALIKFVISHEVGGHGSGLGHPPDEGIGGMPPRQVGTMVVNGDPTAPGYIVPPPGYTWSEITYMRRYYLLNESDGQPCRVSAARRP